MNDQAPSKALAGLRAGSPLLSIMPQSLEDVARMARMAVMAGLVIVPKRRGGASEDDESRQDGTEDERLLATASIIILKGLEVGLPPMQAMETISVINGRTLIWGDAVPGLLWRAGFKIEEWFTGDEASPADDFTAHCKVTRPDGTVISRSFSVRDAKRSKLWDAREKVDRWVRDWDNPGSKKKVKRAFDNDSPWFRFWKRMLQMRARGFATKDGASDVLRGLYIREEYEANEIVDVTPSKAISSSSSSIDDIPDPSSVEVATVAASEPETLTTKVEPMSEAEENHQLEALRGELEDTPPPLRGEVVENYSDTIERMSDSGQRRAQRIIEELS